MSLILISCSQENTEDDVKINPPTQLNYEETNISLEKNIPFDFIFPTVSGENLEFSISPDLPIGLIIDKKNGFIGGIPTEIIPPTDFTVRVSNGGGFSEFVLNIVVNERPIPSIRYENSSYTSTIGQEISAIDIIATGATFTSFNLVNNNLPNGLTLNTTTGEISGTPNELLQNRTVTIEGKTSDDNSVFTSVIFNIIDNPPENLLYAQSVFQFQRNTDIGNYLPSNQGGSIISYSINPPLPNGFNFNSQTGEISGTPLSIKIPSNYIITGNNTGGSTTTSISIEVLDLPPQNLSYGTNSILMTRNTEFNEIFPTTNGGGLATSYAISPPLPNGLIFSTSTGGISGTPINKKVSSDYIITATNSGGSTSTTLSILIQDLPPQNLSYNIVSDIFIKNTSVISLSPSSNGGDIAAYSINPQLPDGINFNTITGIISGTPSIVSAARSYTVTASNSRGNSQYSFFLAVKDEAPRNLSYPQNSLILEIGQPLTGMNASNTGGDITNYSVSPGLPQGLSINNQTGEISGIPENVVASNNYIVRGTNATDETFYTINIKVNDIAPSNLSYGPVNYNFDRGINISTLIPSNLGGDITNYSVSPALPQGLSIDNQTGEISGIPEIKLEETEFEITGINTGGQIITSIFISINDFPPSDLFYGDIPYKLRKGTSLGSEGLQPVYTGGDITNWSILPALPQGLYLDQLDGAIKGTPLNKNENFITYTITGSNTGGQTTANIIIQITDIPPEIRYNQSSYSFTRNETISIIPITNGGDIDEFLSIPSVLPSGLTLNSQTGEISGIPDTISELTNYRIIARNSGGSSDFFIDIEVLPIIPNSISLDSAFIPNKSSSYDASTKTIIFERELLVDPNDSTTSSYCVGSPCSLVEAEINFSIDNLTFDNWETTIGDNVTWTISPELPTGFIFDSITGKITGRSQIGTDFIEYTLTGSNNGGSVELKFNLKIQDLPPSNLLYSQSSYSFPTGDTIIIQGPVNDGGDITNYSISPSLPSGMEINPTNGTISKIEGQNVLGQPETSYTITGSNAEGSTSVSILLTLTDSPPAELIYEKDGLLGEGITYFTFEEFSSFFPTNTGGAIETYNTVEFFKVSPGPNYPADSSDLTTETISSIPSNLIFNNQTGEISGTPVDNALNQHKFFSIEVTGQNNGGITPTVLFIYFNSRPIASVGSNIEGTINESVSLSGSSIDEDIINFNNGDWPFGIDKTAGREENYTWEIVSKPSNSLITNTSISNSNTLNPSFVPDALGTYSFTLKVNDGISTSTNDPVITVSVVDVPPSNLSYGATIYGFDNFLYNIGDNINLIPSSEGGDVITYSIDKSLPSGLSFDTNTGVISGSPQVSLEPEDFIITASNTGGSTNRTVKLWINKKPIAAISGNNKLEFGEVYQLDGSLSSDDDFNFSQAAPFDVNSVNLEYNWSIESKPIGSSLSSASFSSQSNIVSITPDTKGEYIFGLVVSDGFDSSEKVLKTITVASSPKNISYGSTTFGENIFVYNESDSVNIVPTFEGDSAIFSITPSLPAGLVLNENTGQISGIVSNNSLPTNYTITAINGGGSSSANISIWINQIPEINFTSEINNVDISNSYQINSVSVNDIDENIINNTPYDSLSKNISWTILAKPMNSLLDNISNVVNPQINFDEEGEYILKLDYNDGLADISNDVIVKIITTNNSENNLPIANLGDHFLEKNVGDNFILDGSNSLVKKGSINYNWTILQQPINSLVSFTDSTLSSQSLSLDEEGQYLIQLEIFDGIDYAYDFVYIISTNSKTNIVDNEITTNTTFSINNSPYNLTGDIIIRDGAVVNIDAGVVFYGNSNNIIIEDGTLNILGLDKNYVYFKNIFLGSASGNLANFNINYIIYEGGAICPTNIIGFSSCSGNFNLQKSIIKDLTNVESRLGVSINDYNINENIFVNSHGFILSSLSSEINFENNFIVNANGGEVPFGEYFIKINQDNNQKIKINKNYFSNQLDEQLIIGTTTNQSDLRLNNWSNEESLSNINNWLFNLEFLNITPYSLDQNNLINNQGFKYVNP